MIIDKCMKKGLKIIIAIIVIILILIVVLRFNPFSPNGGEDNWIKDSRGIYVKHGNPAEIPDYVSEQQIAVICAKSLFNSFNATRIPINSQCLGRCQNYAVDIVHVPRNAEDDKIENQCEEYRRGIVQHFIELDKNEEIVRVV
jgi:hypothetical protein